MAALPASNTISIKPSDKPLTGLWQPGPIVPKMFYGGGCVSKYLKASLPSSESRVFVVTSEAVSLNTPLVQDLRDHLGDQFIGLYAAVKEHCVLDGVHEAVEVMALAQDEYGKKISTILGLGGGSSIDFAKILSHQACANCELGPFAVMAIPTTLSAAETSIIAYYSYNDTKFEFIKTYIGVKIIFYDPEYSQYTPKQIWLGTGITALSHAVETMYHPDATEFPSKANAIWAAKILFDDLKAMAADWPATRDHMTRLFLAAHASNSMKSNEGTKYTGLSHQFAFALGAPFKVPDRVINAITLGEVVIFKGVTNEGYAKQLARLLPATGKRSTGVPATDATELGKSINALVNKLGLRANLSDYGLAIGTVQDIAAAIAGPQGHGEISEADCKLMVARFYR